MVHRGHPLRFSEIPALGRIAGVETPAEQLGAHGPVDEEHTPLGDEIVENGHWSLAR